MLDTFTHPGSTHEKVRRVGESFKFKLYGTVNFKTLDEYYHISNKKDIHTTHISHFRFSHLTYTNRGWYPVVPDTLVNMVTCCYNADGCASAK